MEVNSINRIGSAISLRVQHSLKEKNTFIDLFANMIFIFAGTYEFISFQEVSSEGKKITNLDKCNTPNIRFKQTSPISTFN